MARYQIRDLTKVSQPENINLKSALQQDENSISKKSTLATSAINLKPLLAERNHRQLWNNRPSNFVDGIRFQGQQPIYNLVPAEKIYNSSPSRFAPVVRIAVSGLVIVLIINLFNVFAVGLRFRSNLISNASSGLENIMSGVDQTKKLSLSAAQTEFNQAQENFNQALEKVSFLKTSNSFANENNFNSLQGILNAGKDISEAGKLFSESGENLQKWPDLFIQANRDLAIGKTSVNSSTDQGNNKNSLTDILKSDFTNVQAAIEKLNDASSNLDQVDANVLPEPYRQQLPEIKARLAKLNAFLNELSEQIPAVLKLLGDRYPHRYLVLLQNDTESRPTGGFIGSLMIVDVNDGIITRADFHDVYQYDGQLNIPIEAPEDIAQITDNWRLRDSNYSPDFALSAEKAAWFLQKSKGPSVDTIIAVNQSAIADLIAELGPIQVDTMKAPIDSNNFQFILSYLIESKYYGQENPKKILEKVVQSFKEKILHMDNPREFIMTLAKITHDQKILFYSRDEQVQVLFENFHLTPHQLPADPDQDYLQVVATSIGGNKSDLYVTQNLEHQTFVDPAGTLNDELTITRKHNWSEVELARWNVILDKFGFDPMPENIQTILGRGNNKASIKVYVPLGSELENAVGIDTSKVLTRHDAELQKTYFLFPMEVAPGDEKSITIRYKLPHSLDLLPASIYRFTAQKQLSLVPTILKKSLKISPPLSLLKNSQPQAEEGIKLRDDFQMRAVIAN